MGPVRCLDLEIVNRLLEITGSVCLLDFLELSVYIGSFLLIEVVVATVFIVVVLEVWTCSFSFVLVEYKVLLFSPLADAAVSHHFRDDAFQLRTY